MTLHSLLPDAQIRRRLSGANVYVLSSAVQTALQDQQQQQAAEREQQGAIILHLSRSNAALMARNSHLEQQMRLAREEASYIVACSPCAGITLLRSLRSEVRSEGFICCCLL